MTKRVITAVALCATGYFLLVSHCYSISQNVVDRQGILALNSIMLGAAAAILIFISWPKGD